jgi:hypothetical protein
MRLRQPSPPEPDTSRASSPPRAWGQQALAGCGSLRWRSTPPESASGHGGVRRSSSPAAPPSSVSTRPPPPPLLLRGGTKPPLILRSCPRFPFPGELKRMLERR